MWKKEREEKKIITKLLTVCVQSETETRGEKKCYSQFIKGPHNVLSSLHWWC